MKIPFDSNIFMTLIPSMDSSEGLEWKRESKIIYPSIEEERKVVFFSQISLDSDNLKGENYKLWYKLSNIDIEKMQDIPKMSRSLASINTNVSIANRILESKDNKLNYDIYDLEEALIPSYDVDLHVAQYVAQSIPSSSTHNNLSDELAVNTRKKFCSHEMGMKKFLKDEAFSSCNLSQMHILEQGPKNMLSYNSNVQELDSQVFSHSRTNFRLLSNST